MNSWLPSMRSPDRAATARALETASVRPISVKASAAGASMRQVPAEKSGNDRPGIAEGSDQRDRADGRCPAVDVSEVSEEGRHRAGERWFLSDGQAEEIAQLCGNDQQACARGEADDDRRRNEVDQ